MLKVIHNLIKKLTGIIRQIKSPYEADWGDMKKMTADAYRL